MTNRQHPVSSMGRAYLALGANLGDAFATLEQALAFIRHSDDFQVTAVSAFYRTAPVEARGPDFCNAVIEVNTPLSPEELLTRCLSIEEDFGRIRSTKNAPRTLDIDVIAIDGVQSHTATLTLPHPRAHERAFVLVPLCELNPLTMLGPSGATLASAAQWLDRLGPVTSQDITRWSQT